MKKTLAVLLVSAMVIGLAGCAGTDTGTATTAAKAATTAAATTATPAAAATTGAKAAATTAAAAAGSTGKGVVYGIYKAGDQTWFIDEGKAAKAAVEKNGDTFTYVDAKMSPEEYLKAIDNAIANKAKGIVTCIPDQTMSQAVVDKCKARIFRS